MSALWMDLTRGIWRENPIFIIVLGLCPTLAVTNTAVNGLAMGLATLFVLLCSELIISLFKSFIPHRVRIPCFIVVIATFVTITDMGLAAYLPHIHQVLGLFIPLIVVNCLILGRNEAFASKNPTLPSLADALGMGIGFTWALTFLGGVREMLGFGSLFEIEILGEWFTPLIIMILPSGAFITLGILLGCFNALNQRSR